MLCNDMSCHVMSCHDMSSHVMSCHVKALPTNAPEKLDEVSLNPPNIHAQGLESRFD